MLSQDSEDEIRSRFEFELAILLWQVELNPRVRCAFGNVFPFHMVNFSSVMQIYRTEKRGKKVTKVEVENLFPGCRIMVLQGGTYQVGRSAEKCKRRKKNPGICFLV